MTKNMDHQINKYLDTVTDEMTFGEAREGVRKELLSHIQEQIETAMSYGVSKEDAATEALTRMGSAEDIGISLNKVHQPKLDLLIPLFTISLSAIGIWSLSGSYWASLQTIWIFAGAILALAIYLAPVRIFKKITVSLYGVALLGLALSHFSGIVHEGQPYLAIAGLNIKMVDLAGVLLALGLPFLGSSIKLPPHIARIWLDVLRIALFLAPMAYFSLNGFVWPGLLFLVSGLCYVGMSGISNLGFISTGLIASGMLATRFAESLVPAQDLNRAIIENAHTDFALRAMSQALLAEAAVGSLLVALVMYGLKISFLIKDFNLRMTALVGMSLMTMQVVTSVLANLGLLPMISAGINIPFISYGGSGIIANFLIVGVLLGCLKRQSLGAVA